MPRVNVWLPEELHQLLKSSLPHVNVSQLLQDAIRGVLGCRHEQLACAACAEPVDRWAMLDEHLGRFYADLLAALEALVARCGTAEGAARVLRDVAVRWRVSGAEQTPLPRATRAEREAARARDLTASQGGRHPARRTGPQATTPARRATA